jgi:hypothetical protein
VSEVQAQFPATDVWDRIVDLLHAQLEGVDVKHVTDKDFDGNGELVLTAPSVRVMYVNSHREKIENQCMAYETVHRVLILCGDEDRRSSIDQARASLALSERVEVVVAGARILLSTTERSEPVCLGDTEPLPVNGLGTAYAVAIEVPGPAIYPAPNANPQEPA